MTEFLNPQKIREEYGFSRDMTYGLLNAGGCPIIRAGRNMLIARDSFEEWLKSYEGKKILLARQKK